MLCRLPPLRLNAPRPRETDDCVLLTSNPWERIELLVVAGTKVRSFVAESVAAFDRVIVVPLLMAAIRVFAGMPVPVTNMPPKSPVVLATVMEVVDAFTEETTLVLVAIAGFQLRMPAVFTVKPPGPKLVVLLVVTNIPLKFVVPAPTKLRLRGVLLSAKVHLPLMVSEPPAISLTIV